MAIENLAVFTFPPDWKNETIETLAWMTSVTESPHAVEQRMGLRLSPRQMIEMSFTIFKSQRSHFDLLMMAAAGSPIWVPLWYDEARLTSSVLMGGTTLNLDTQYTELQNCRVAILYKSNFIYELVEIDSFTNSSLTLVSGTESEWPAGTKVYPVKKCRVETQPSGDRHADEAFTGRIRFLSLEPNKSNAEANLSEYLGNYVLEDEPNEAGGIAYNYQRKEYRLDTEFGLQIQSDVAPYVNQRHPWFAKGRLRAWRLRGLLYALQGMRRPIWVPTFFNDLQIIEPAEDSDVVITIRRCGYVDTGGPFLHRQHILIHLRDGTRIYRKIVDSDIVGDNETIELETAAGVALSPDNVLRISFMTFCRLDQDTIELVHMTDSKGVTTASLNWRTDPGIGGAYSETTTEIEPPDPENPPPLVVIDPFRVPVGKIWVYDPSFGTFAGSDWVSMWWGARRSNEELIEDNPQLSGDLGAPFGIIVPPGSPTTIRVPEGGSFLVRCGVYFSRNGWTTDTISLRILFVNSELDPVEMTSLGGVVIEEPTAQRMHLQSDRESVFFAKIDTEQPLDVVIQFKFTGTGNLVPISNPDDDPEPYHGDTVSGDSYFIVEWWPD